ncbi:MAG: 1-acyl-sn-glycerol-3-phosphate acyltransferase [Chitinophagales bacterium]|nr:1-acyl-sn-glycerol-3-phosphate acyltransferase [Chitinophagales bacterium]
MPDTDNSHQPQIYKRIIEDIEKWPIARISRDREAVIHAIVEETLQNILQKNKTEHDVHEELAKAVYLEKIRLNSKAWKTDPEDDKAFWNDVKNKLVEFENKADNDITEETALLRKIITRYVTEIAGNFKPRTYRFAERFVPFAFNRLLNASHSKAFRKIFGNKKDLLKSINLVGEIDQARTLTEKGIMIMVPTHISNIDSITVGWGVSAIGLPSFFYGAGLNLFSVRFLAYFMKRLGAYKVDRRKKNAIYLESLKSYSTQIISRGGHSLFFPGGTRSRSGLLETQLKLGLLGTALEAQRRLIEEAKDNNYKKVYVIPVTLNYGFVLEAPELIDEYLRNVGKERYFVPSDKYSSSFKLVKFMIRFFTADADFTIAFGRSMDIFGNPVDDAGKSLDAAGNEIDISDYFKRKGALADDTQRDSVFTKMVSENILDAFKKNNVAMPEHVVAFAAFKLFLKKNPENDVYAVLRTPEENRELNRAEFKTTLEKLVKEIIKLSTKEKIRIDPLLEADIEEVMDYGVKKLGVYHTKKPLVFIKNGEIKCNDMKVLFFYHNRLEGYGLEKHV